MTAAKKPSHHTVLTLRVTGGFLGGAALEFADGLNCIIGGRGTGKTTALEFLRFSLGLMPDPRTNQGRHRTIENLIKNNLGGGRVATEVRTRGGLRYTAERSASEAVQVFNETGAPVPVSLDGDLIFGADVFSQNEIEEIASSPLAQLALLDRFVEGEASIIVRELEQLHRQLDQTTTELKRLDAETEDLRASASELPVLEEKLKALAPLEGPDSVGLNAAQTAKGVRARESLLPERLVKAVTRAANETRAAHAAFNATLDAQLEADFRTGANSTIILALEADLRTYLKTLEVTTVATSEAARVALDRVRVHAQALAQRHAEEDAHFSKLVSSSEHEGGRMMERVQLEARVAAAAAAFKDVEARGIQHRAIVARRADVMRQISELRDRRFAARKRVAEDLTGRLEGAIRVTVTQSADLERYGQILADALKGSGLKQGVAAERLAEALLPTELAEAVANKDIAPMVRAGFDDSRARKILDALTADGRGYDIEAVDLDDLPKIELLDGDQYKDSPNLSTGQRCTTILPILLVQSDRPLLIDQPEDNLDNKFIYDTVVKALRSAKGKRQVIFVTHNPNIPVLGEAERIFVFESDGRHAQVRRVGTVDECKADVETILEGGREAFRQRKERYGH